MLKAMLCVALLICVLRLQGLCDRFTDALRRCMPYPTATHPSAAYPSQDFAETITLETRALVLTHWRRELQSDYWPSKRKLEPAGHDA
jgi:hypothetical protein